MKFLNDVNKKKKCCPNESEIRRSEVFIVPDAEMRAKSVGNIDLKNTVDARPCDCTACGSCRCTPCK